ncbi:YeiH family protein [Quisquiliibacterium transsilvanicum]|uniref:Putative integral membrane protein (TIGR00698 family) n=1 Tax=Quisquiliibacterium transsilvanicum TaxID=1549638 RepID=A0A7W8HJN6_9BURK|nr:putative sulfate exporter family transporter [Quisquiliibacterium transsilvanicum]MBB5272691.1 putative integral membrane protein (TIGR00698 family) [Quisquiliibacterium transsilvanicum]
MRPLAAAPGSLAALAIALAASYLAERYQGPQLLFALMLGMAFNFAAESRRLKPGLEFASRTVLRFGVALLGTRIGLEQIVALGAAPAAIVVAAVAGTIAFGWLLARLMRRPASEGLLTGGAVAICGASAALAISAVLPAGKDQQRFTLLTVVGVTTLSTIAMVFYPTIAGELGLDARQAAIFLGGSIHDVAQVVGAGFMISPEVGDGATLVKLLRVAMLVPVVVLFAHLFRNGHGGSGAQGKRPPILPGFLVAFVLLVALNSAGVVPAGVARGLGEVSRWCLVVAIAALGVKTSLMQLAELGWKPVAMMVAETLFIAAVVLGGIALARG